MCFSCKCTNWKLLSWRTAKKDRDVAQRREDLLGNRFFFRYRRVSKVQNQIPCSSPQHSPDDQSASHESEYSSPFETLSKKSVSEKICKLLRQARQKFYRIPNRILWTPSLMIRCTQIIDPKFYNVFGKSIATFSALLFATVRVEYFLTTSYERQQNMTTCLCATPPLMVFVLRYYEICFWIQECTRLALICIRRSM